jgi:hypothetical protein
MPDDDSNSATSALTSRDFDQRDGVREDYTTQASTGAIPAG